MQADVARMLRTRDEDHAAGICRALSLPIDENEGGGDAGGVARSVVFKSVPAVWKSERAMAEGYCSGDASALQQHPQGLKSSLGSGARNGASTCRGSAREDDLVGLTRALAVTVVGDTNDGEEGHTPVTATCDDCAGFGCSWCDNGVVKVEEVVGGGQEEGLWETALCPT